MQPRTKMKKSQFAGHARSLGTRAFGMRRKIATVFAIALAALLGYHIVFGANGLTVFSGKRRDLRDLQSQVRVLQRENGDLQGHVDRLTSDPNAIEHEAREDLHYTRPGEVIFTLPPEKGSVQALSSQGR